jgi:hypothetical protein
VSTVTGTLSSARCPASMRHSYGSMRAAPAAHDGSYDDTRAGSS